MSTKVVLFVEGGVVHRIISDDDVEVVILDADVEGAESTAMVAGSEYVVSHHEVDGCSDATECTVIHDEVTGNGR